MVHYFQDAARIRKMSDCDRYSNASWTPTRSEPLSGVIGHPGRVAFTATTATTPSQGQGRRARPGVRRDRAGSTQTSTEHSTPFREGSARPPRLLDTNSSPILQPSPGSGGSAWYSWWLLGIVIASSPSRSSLSLSQPLLTQVHARVALVRTGFGGQRIVISGMPGAALHKIDEINMRTIRVKCGAPLKSLITDWQHPSMEPRVLRWCSRPSGHCHRRAGDRFPILQSEHPQPPRRPLRHARSRWRPRRPDSLHEKRGEFSATSPSSYAEPVGQRCAAGLGVADPPGSGSFAPPDENSLQRGGDAQLAEIIAEQEKAHRDRG